MKGVDWWGWVREAVRRIGSTLEKEHKEPS